MCQSSSYTDFFTGFIHFSYQTCGCGHPFYWNVRAVVITGTNKKKHIKLCDIHNPCYSETRINFMNTQSIWGTLCSECTNECSHTDFIIKSSALLAPPKCQLNQIKEFVESSNISLSTNWSTLWISEIQSNYLSLEVSYETIRTDLYSEEPKLSAVDVISNVGGQTGLWIGISFLSLMEIAEMIYRLIRSQCHTLRTATKNRRQNSMN